MNDAPSESTQVEIQRQRASQLAQALRQELHKAVIGQQEIVDGVLTALIAGGHVLVEGVPGLGKTLLVRALARCFGGEFSRIQFTPDLMPSDITGHAVYDLASEQFRLRKGPVFTNLLLADEINRAPAKTQAALLEVMQEHQVTIEGRSFAVGQPFMVLATQNPIEQEGTYPLPEAELDRFMFKLRMDYPAQDDEVELVRRVTDVVRDQDYLAGLTALITPEGILQLQKQARMVTTDRQILDYAVRLVSATRDWRGISRGAGPRGSIGLVQAARAAALIQGRGFVLPDDIKRVAKPVLRHRIMLGAEMEIEGIRPDRLLEDILEQVDAPRP